jgi:hypothetical protein
VALLDELLRQLPDPQESASLRTSLPLDHPMYVDWRDQEARGAVASGNYQPAKRPAPLGLSLAERFEQNKPLELGKFALAANEHLGKGIKDSVVDFATLPGDALAGKVPFALDAEGYVDPLGNPEANARYANFALNMTGLGGASHFALGAGERGAALGMNAPVKIAQESAVPAGRQRLVSSMYDAASKKNIIGDAADTHGTLASKNYDVLGHPDDMGFTNSVTGERMSRPAAMDWLKTNDPETYAAYGPYANSGRLEAKKYIEAFDKTSPLKGMPLTADVPGFGSLAVGPNAAARGAAESYMKNAGMKYDPPREYVPVDPERAARVADEFERMPHRPSDPEVASSYGALINETKAQFEAMPPDLKIEFIKPGMKDPYGASPRLVQKDIAENNHMWVYPTESGFGQPIKRKWWEKAGLKEHPLQLAREELGLGPKSWANKSGRYDERGGNADVNRVIAGETGTGASRSPMLEDSGVVIDGRKLANNDLFRIVHDYFGHAKEGVGFRATGEDNAFRQHRSMYSPAAQRALTTETRGQNSWLNYGPQGAKNRTAKTEDTTFADQKVGLMPEWTTLYSNSKKTAPLSLAAGASGDNVVSFQRAPKRTFDDAVAEQKPSVNPNRPDPDISLIRQALNSKDPQTQAHLEQVWGTLSPRDRAFLEERLSQPVKPISPYDAANLRQGMQEGLDQALAAPLPQMTGDVIPFRGRPKDEGGLFANSKKTAPLSLAASLDDFPFDSPDAKFVGEAVENPFGPVYGKQTVRDPVRNSFPGIYDNPKEIAAAAAKNVEPESPWLKRLFGVTRDDLYEMSGKGTRKGNIDDFLLPQTGRSKAAQQVTTPENAQRVLDILSEVEKASPELVRGMDPWYVMDPAFHRLVELVGADEAIKRYNNLNAYTSGMSPGSQVSTEINRGTAANYLAQQGRFAELGPLINSGGSVRGAKKDLADLEGHIYGKTSHLPGLTRYNETGNLTYSPDVVKVPLYYRASGVPETGFQTHMPVPDAHFTRGLGIPDVRTAETQEVQNASMKKGIYAPTGKWYRENVSDQLGIEAVPAQARQWGTLAHITGVKTKIGAPKLELLARNIGERAERYARNPEKLRDMVLMGEDFAVNPAPLGPLGLMWGMRDD